MDQLDNLVIRTNHTAREPLRWYDLTPKERAEFDYLDTEQRQDDAQFVRYRGATYDLGEFTLLHSTALGPRYKGWTGQHSDSAFSGILLRWVQRDGEWLVVMGNYYC